MVFFVYRSVYQGPSGRLVRHLPDATVLGWFQRVWDEASAGDAAEWIERELGASVYGLASIFEAGLPAPRTLAELHRMLEEHLYVELELRVDEHSVRVLTDDDEVMLAYFFVEDHVVAAEPDRWAYLLHDGWELPAVPAGAGGGTPFTPPGPTWTATSAPPGGEGETYAVVLTFSATSDSIGWNLPARFPGVRLPRLAAALRETDAAIEEWSEEPAVVRALVAPDEDEIGPALERCNRWPDFDQRVAELQGAHGRAHEVALRLVAGFEPTRGREPHRTMIRRSEHLAQMAMHTDGYFGYRQWFFFDDVWAAAHPALAASLMHYGVHWDPRCPCDHETFDCVP